MIRPLSFGYNAETGQTNVFQHDVLMKRDPAVAAREEFDAMVANLAAAGVEVTVFEDREDVASPDAVFSNNWVSFHQSGKVVLYPMLAENRRRERRLDIIESLRDKFQVEEIIDLSHFEKEGKFLEGTGSMVFDRRFKIAYAALSPRTHLEPLQAFSEAMGYEIVQFSASDEKGYPLYHTNVMMCIGDGFAVVCLNALKNEDERYNLRKVLEETDKQIIEIFPEQLAAFAGNMLMVRNNQNQKMMVMSTAAFHSLSTQQKTILEEFTARLIYADLSVIEALGGGSARCMMTEIHLPEK
ncbi:arginine deiminase-related protein [Ravibacter arvi]|uniref:Arginine deiminase-related protein n=2 Tax=Ravibacter arvi TaxID=2051041 RepID=A0ABP8M4T2_9BACT